MTANMERSRRGEDAWRWICRGLAVIGFGFLLVVFGVNVPWGFYVLLVGLFFGPDAVRGQLQINRKVDDRDE